MLNRCYYLNDQEDPDAAAHQMAATVAGITVTQLLECRGASTYARLLDRQYSRDGNFRFCLGLKGSATEVVAKAIESLLFFFHPFYETAVRGKPLFIFADAAQSDCIRIQLAELFYPQRIIVELLFVDEIATAAYPGETLFVLDADRKGSADDYFHYCLTAYRSTDIFLVKGANIESFIANLRFKEAELSQHYPVLHELASGSREMHDQINSLSRQNHAFREENAIFRELLELSGKHDEVNYILRFYKNEYEILPLWYKRLGHIIKVLQGKRSLRSLYDKRAKKYKE